MARKHPKRSHRQGASIEKITAAVQKDREDRERNWNPYDEPPVVIRSSSPAPPAYDPSIGARPRKIVKAAKAAEARQRKRGKRFS